jgi:Mor family transcriptional regulator
MLETLSEAVGGRAADVIIGKTMALFGGLQIYIPKDNAAANRLTIFGRVLYWVHPNLE